MAHPVFFDSIPTITLRDPLAQLLGSAQDGLITYSYGEIVKLTGHSCPTVAGAWLMTTRALQHLYGDDIPERGGIVLRFRSGAEEGVTGVIASVAGFITGAAGEGGFKGLKGQHVRRNLLSFNEAIDGEIQFERLDTGAGVTVSFDASAVPAAPELMPRLFTALEADSSAEQRAEFAQMWQDRVRRIFEQADAAGMVRFS